MSAEQFRLQGVTRDGLRARLENMAKDLGELLAIAHEIDDYSTVYLLRATQEVEDAISILKGGEK